MSQPVLDLNGIKSLYAKGLAHARKKFSSQFSSKNDDLSNLILNTVNNAQDLTTLMNAIWIPNQTWASAFKGPKPVCSSCLLSKTGIQFGVGNNEWYFFYGLAGNYAYNISFFKSEIAPPEIVSEQNIPPSEAVRWMVLGGIGTVSPQAWYSIQPEWIYMKYDQPTYSTFSLNGSGNNISVSLGSSTPMQFSINLSFTDPNNLKHTFNLNSIPNLPPAPNFPGACACADNLGSLYYSYTNSTVTVTQDNGTPTSGSGWIDHQLVKNGQAKGWYARALQQVTGILSGAVTGGWLWFSFMDNSTGKQYLLTHFFGNKFYADQIKVGDNIPLSVANLYEKGVTHFNQNIKVKLLATTPGLNGMPMPSKYSIKLEDGRTVTLAIATPVNIYPNAIASYETVSTLSDDQGNIIGSGLIEANLYLTNAQLAQRYASSIGNSSATNAILAGLAPKQNFWRKLYAFLVVLIPFWILVGSLIFILYKKDKRRIRAMLTLAILLVLIVSWYSV